MLYRPCWSHRLMGKLPLVLVLTLILTPPLIIWLQRSGISISFVLDASPYGRLTGSANDSAAASSRSTPNAEVEKRTREFKIHQRPSTFPSSLGADQHVLGEARILARPSDKSNKEDSTFTEAAGGIISTSGGTQSPRVTVINAPPADPSEDLVLTNLLSKVKAEELVPEQERSQWILYVGLLNKQIFTRRLTSHPVTRIDRTESRRIQRCCLHHYCLLQNARLSI